MIFIKISVVILCISLVFAIENASDPDDELIFTHILYRHGDRNIIDTYPTDPYADEKNWPGGLGQLTNLGRQQHYELGAYLRRRYFNLIANNGSYHKDNIYVRSTDVDRTLMSASHNLAGLFPPSGDQIWNGSLLWQGIPIHTMPEHIDYVLAMKRPCPRYIQAHEEYLNSDEVKAILYSNKTLIKYLEKHSGQTIHTIDQVKVIYQALWVENLKNFELPKWTEAVFVPGGDLEKLAQFHFVTEANTKLLARLKTGFLLREILERFTKKKDSTLEPDRSLWVYSAHDSTIANVLNTLGLFKRPHIPNYASCLFFELHKINASYHIELYYKSERGDDPVPLKPLLIPNCGPRCPLEKWYQIYRDVIPTEDFDTECRLPETEKHTKKSVRSSSNKVILFPACFIIGLIVKLLAN